MSKRKRILVGGPSRGLEGPIFALHRASLENQATKHELVVRHVPVADVGGPRWHDMKIDLVAQARQRMCDQAVNEGFDYLWMVDDDVVCADDVLQQLLEVPTDIVYGVYWTVAPWVAGPPRPWPQVWDRHPYGFSPELWEELKENEPGRHVVLGGGGCTLINVGYLKPIRAQYYPLLRSIRYSGGMWGGEDRTFNIRAEVREVTQMAVTGLKISHLHDVDPGNTELLAAISEWTGVTVPSDHEVSGGAELGTGWGSAVPGDAEVEDVLPGSGG